MVTWEPRVFYYPNFLTDEECAHFISKGLSEGLIRSAVAASGDAKESTARTSYGTFIMDDADFVVDTYRPTPTHFLANPDCFTTIQT